jgi:hypothetical protein
VIVRSFGVTERAVTLAAVTGFLQSGTWRVATTYMNVNKS